VHESAVAKSILHAVLERACVEKARRVHSVRGWVAETETLRLDSLAFHFAAYARGTPAEGATLDLRLTHVKARCEQCGLEYLPDHHVLLCSGCGSTRAQLLSSTGLGIESIDVE
jgi:hydrogenase nickel incorporation protein HypA/HybF